MCRDDVRYRVPHNHHNITQNFQVVQQMCEYEPNWSFQLRTIHCPLSLKEELLCSPRHEINYWFNDALVSLKAITQLLLHVAPFCFIVSVIS